MTSFDANAVETVDRLVKGAIKLDKWSAQDGPMNNLVAALYHCRRLISQARAVDRVLMLAADNARKAPKNTLCILKTRQLANCLLFQNLMKHEWIASE